MSVATVRGNTKVCLPAIDCGTVLENYLNLGGRRWLHTCSDGHQDAGNHDSSTYRVALGCIPLRAVATLSGNSVDQIGGAA